MLQCSQPLFRHELSLCHSKAAVGGNEAKFLLIPATGLQTVPENNVPGSNNTRKRNGANTYMSAARTNDSLFWSPFDPESVQNVPLSRRLFLKKSRACCRGRYIQQIQQLFFAVNMLRIVNGSFAWNKFSRRMRLQKQFYSQIFYQLARHNAFLIVKAR